MDLAFSELLAHNGGVVMDLLRGPVLVVVQEVDKEAIDVVCYRCRQVEAYLLHLRVIRPGREGNLDPRGLA